MKYFLMIAIAVLATGAFGAQGKGIEGLPIKLGDSVEKVRAALGTTLEPESFTRAAEGDAKALRLKTKGIWVFFDREGRTYGIRLEPPFAGNAAGVKIGRSAPPSSLKLSKAPRRATPRRFVSRPKVYGYPSIATAGPTAFGSIHHLPETLLA